MVSVSLRSEKNKKRKWDTLAQLNQFSKTVTELKSSVVEPDPEQNGTAPQHCIEKVKILSEIMDETLPHYVEGVDYLQQQQQQQR